MDRLKIIKDYISNQRDYFSRRNLIRDDIKDGINISLVIPAFNEEKLLPQLLLLLNHQRYKSFEVIVVDNDSKDSTLLVAENLKQKTFYPLYVIRENEKGAGNARKRGMDEVVLRLLKKDVLQKHFIVIADADIITPNCWLETINRRFLEIESGVLAGTHGAREEIDKAIREKLGINCFFNSVPKFIENLVSAKLGIIKASGPNTAFEVETYAAAGGMKQEYDEKTQRVKLNETNLLVTKIRKLNYPILPMGVRVIANKRRQLAEIINGADSYFPPGFSEKERFNTIRREEDDLLKIALEKILKPEWLKYRKRMINTVIKNFIAVPLLEKEINLDSFSAICKPDELDNLRRMIDKPQSQDLIVEYWYQKFIMMGYLYSESDTK